MRLGWVQGLGLVHSPAGSQGRFPPKTFAGTIRSFRIGFKPRLRRWPAATLKLSFNYWLIIILFFLTKVCQTF